MLGSYFTSKPLPHPHKFDPNYYYEFDHPLLPSMQGTVKKAMSEFRRTHYDSWSEHKQKFTDDQLAVLADLLISPSYYA